MEHAGVHSFSSQNGPGRTSLCHSFQFHPSKMAQLEIISYIYIDWKMTARVITKCLCRKAKVSRHACNQQQPSLHMPHDEPSPSCLPAPRRSSRHATQRVPGPTRFEGTTTPGLLRCCRPWTSNQRELKIARSDLTCQCKRHQQQPSYIRSRSLGCMRPTSGVDR